MANDLATSLEESRSMAAEETPASTLVTLENVGALDPLVIFKAGGIKPILEAIEKEVLSIVPDLSTVKSRKEIASLARKVATSKKTIDGMGKGLADDLNAKLKPINSERKTARDQLDNLRDKARQPLTEWEAEQKRIADEEAARVEAEELAVKVDNDHELGILLHDKFLQEELTKLEERAAAKCAHERRIAEAARLEAEAKAKADIERVEREKQEAIEREAQAKRSQIAAEERAKVQAEQAEKARVEAEKQAKLNAEFVANQAREYEIERQKEIQAKKAEAEAKRLADREYVVNVLGEIKLSIIGLGATEELAKSITLALYKNNIPHTTVKF